MKVVVAEAIAEAGIAALAAFCEVDVAVGAGRAELLARIGGATGLIVRSATVVDAEMSAGVTVGVNGTPAVFINGRPLPGGAVPFEMVAELIDDELERLGR